MNTQQAYPLSWPVSWPRAKTSRGPSRFSRKSMERAATEIYQQLRLIGVGDYNVVISTNVELRRDGIPYSNQKRPADPGAAVYFKLKNRPQVLACDKWWTVEENLWSIAMHIDALRAQERWGVGSIEQAFAGYTALNAPGDGAAIWIWYQVLGVEKDAPFEAAREAFLRESKLCHPDNGGSHEAQVRLNAAWDMAKKSYNQ